MVETDREMPSAMRELHELDFDYGDGDGLDFEPYNEFLSAAETRDWIRAWTGNDELEGLEYLVFGQDGTGGYAAFWHVRQNSDLLDQPIVFFGSEGQLGIVAASFADYLWLLARNFGPYEAIAYPNEDRGENPGFAAFAKKHAGLSERVPADIFMRANSEFSTFKEDVQAQCI